MLIQSLLCARVVFLRHFLFPYRGGRMKTLSYLHGKKINVKNVNVSHVNYAIMHVRKCKLYKYFFRKFQFYLKTEFIENEMEDLGINTIFFFQLGSQEKENGSAGSKLKFDYEEPLQDRR